MNKKSMSAFFSENLSAPLANVQWSWGAENENGIYLRIWAEEVKGKAGFLYAFSESDRRLGQKERLRHIKSIEMGKPGYVVVITEGHQPVSGTWRIIKYAESIYPINSLVKKDNGDIYGDIDFDSPVYPEYIGREIDNDAIEKAASKNRKALDTLVKATSKFGWRATKVDKELEKIFLISKDGTQHAQIIIKTGTWVR